MKRRTIHLLAVLAVCCGWPTAAMHAQEEFLPPPEMLEFAAPPTMGVYAGANAPYAAGSAAPGPWHEFDPYCAPGVGGCDLPYMGPLWEARVSNLFMVRQRLSEVVLVTADAGATPLVSAGDFDMGIRIGNDVTFLLHDCLGLGKVEVRSMWLDDFRDSVFAAGNDVSIETFIPTQINLVDPQQVAAFYASEFASVELNYREPFSHWLTVTAGFRYLNVHERLHIDTVDAIGQRTFSRWHTNNDLYGFQLGFELELWNDCDRWSVQGRAKVGAYFNDAKGQVLFATQNLPNGILGRGSDRSPGGDGAFVGEFGLLARYRVHRNLAVHFGYNMVLLDGIVLASEQPSTTGVLPQPQIPMFINKGTLLYHGAIVGMELAY